MPVPAFDSFLELRLMAVLNQEIPEGFAKRQLQVQRHIGDAEGQLVADTGPRDESLRQMPLALDLPPALCNVRKVLPYSVEPGVFRRSMEAFGELTSEDTLSLLLLGRDLTHVWPFMLGQKGSDHEGWQLRVRGVRQGVQQPVTGPLGIADQGQVFALLRAGGDLQASTFGNQVQLITPLGGWR